MSGITTQPLSSSASPASPLHSANSEPNLVTMQSDSFPSDSESEVVEEQTNMKLSDSEAGSPVGSRPSTPDLSKKEPATTLPPGKLYSQALNKPSGQTREALGIRATYEYQLSIAIARAKFVDYLIQIFSPGASIQYRTTPTVKSAASIEKLINSEPLSFISAVSEYILTALKKKHKVDHIVNGQSLLAVVEDLKQTHTPSFKDPTYKMYWDAIQLDAEAPDEAPEDESDDLAPPVDMNFVGYVSHDALDGTLEEDFDSIYDTIKEKVSETSSAEEVYSVFLEALCTHKNILDNENQINSLEAQITEHDKRCNKPKIHELVGKETLTDQESQVLDSLLSQAATDTRDQIVEKQYKIVVEKSCIQLLAYLEEILKSAESNFLLAVDQLIKLINKTAARPLEDNSQQLEKKLAAIYLSADTCSFQLTLSTEKLALLDKALINVLESITDQYALDDLFKPQALDKFGNVVESDDKITFNPDRKVLFTEFSELRKRDNHLIDGIKVDLGPVANKRVVIAEYTEKLADLKKCAEREIETCYEQIAYLKKPSDTPIQLAVKNSDTTSIRLLLKNHAQPDFETKDEADNTIAHLVTQRFQESEITNNSDITYETQVNKLLTADSKQILFDKTNKKGQTPLMMMQATAEYEAAECDKIEARYKTAHEAVKPVLEYLSKKLAARTTTKKDKEDLRRKIAVVLTEINQFSVSDRTNLSTVRDNLLKKNVIQHKRNWWSIFGKSATAKKIAQIKDQEVSINLNLPKNDQQQKSAEYDLLKGQFIKAAQDADKSRKQKNEYLQREKRCEELLLPIERYLQAKIAKYPENRVDESYKLLQEKLTAVEHAKKALVDNGKFSSEILKTALGKERPYTFWKSIPTSRKLLDHALVAEQINSPRPAIAA